MLRRAVLWLRAVIVRRSLEREMREEMDAHLERATERLIARGMGPGEARLAARREFGNVSWMREEGRRARGSEWIGTVVADARHAVRQFTRTPLTTGTILLVLALGIGANTTLFTVLHALATQPAPGVPRDDALVRIRGRQRFASGQPAERGFSFSEIGAYADQRQLFTDVAAWTSSQVTLRLGDADDGVVSGLASYVTGNYFHVLGVGLVAGGGLPRTGPRELSQPPEAIISHALWQQHFGREPGAIGRTIEVNGVRVTIVGVAPARFAGVNRSGQRRVVWLPLGMHPIIERRGSIALMSGDSANLAAVARLERNVRVEDAAAVAGSIGSRIAGPPTIAMNVRDRTTDVAPLLGGNRLPGVTSEAIVASAFSVATLLILAVACVTVSTLLVGTAVARRREVAVRLALGASRRRLVRQFLTESVVLAVGAALLGVLILYVSTRAFGTYAFDLDLEPRLETLAFAIAFAVGTGILFGLSPALHATRLSISDVLKNSAAAVAASRSRLQRSLVVIQISLTQPLLVAVAVLLAMIFSDSQPGPGTTVRDRIIVADFVTYAGSDSTPMVAATLRRLRDRIEQMSGVDGVVPYSDGRRLVDYTIHPADRAGNVRAEPFTARETSIEPGYFAVMDVPIATGRDFRPDDIDISPRPVIIASDLARDLWGSADPIGRRFTQSWRGRPLQGERIVVGVVDAARIGTTEEIGGRRVYSPYNPRTPWIPSTLYVRTTGRAELMIPAIRALATAEAPKIPLASITTLEAIEARSRRASIQTSAAGAAAGLLALLLSSIGLYAVVAFAVAQRTREIGIRIALGARERQVIGMFFRNGLRLGLFGLAVGLPIGLLSLRVFSALTGMPVVYLPILSAAIAAAVMGVASLASWLPARRATRVDPLIALRAE